MRWRDSYGWPVERIRGRRVTNFVRILLHASLRQTLKHRLDPALAAMHASAPSGYKCADCSMDGEACPDCYRVWWSKRHPNVHSH